MSQTKERTIYLAGGCFWGLQAYLDLLPGVKETEAGYAQGSFASPTYDQVCAGGTGHAETVRVVYDASVLPTAKLLDAFFEAIDPTTANRQGPDVGSQYRSGIWWVDEADEQVARAAIRRAQSKRVRGIVTKVEKLAAFYPAEAGHQHYLAAHPGAYCHIDLGKAREFAFSEEGMAGKEGGLSTAERIASHGYAKPKDRVLRGRLTERQYAITQKGATEPPFSSMLDDCFERGIYVDVTTGEPLFSSASKYDAGCGWPSFHKPIDPSVTIESVDKSQGMVRIEVRSHAGNAHLGHVFSDGVSEQGGARYCINGAALRFVPFDEMDAQGYGYLKELVPDVDWGGRS